jgi:hypothetical protein
VAAESCSRKESRWGGREPNGLTACVSNCSCLSRSNVYGPILHALPETGCLPSVWKFAECILSGTRQTVTLPSAEHKELGEREKLGKVVICRVPKI